MKKIIAVLTALIMTVSVMASSFKANAVILEASALAELIEIVSTILVGSGTYTQSQLGSMSNSEILSTYTNAVPNINFTLSEDTCNKIADFLKAQAMGQMLAKDLGFSMLDFMLSNKDTLDTYENPSLNGCGAVLKVYNNKGKLSYIYYGEYGIFDRKSSNCISFVIKNCHYYEYGYSYGDVQSRTDYEKDLGISAWYYYDGGYEFIGNWVYPDGTFAEDLISGASEIPEIVGTVNVDGEELAVNGDGTVIKDGVTYVINDDGSVTIGDTTYYPDYDLSVYPTTTIINLIGDISDNIDVKEDTDEKELIDDITIDVPIEIADSAFSSLTLPKTIATVFPFCIPVDFYNGIKLLSEEPEAPKFEIPFEIPQYKSFPGFKKMIVIDFSEYSTAFAIVRWGFFAIFMFGLCFVTFKIVKGA